VIYIQNLKAGTISNVVRYTTSQAIVPQITMEKGNWWETRNKSKCTCEGPCITRTMTYKNHSPVNSHISGERVPSKLFSRSPLQKTHLPSHKQAKQLEISVPRLSCTFLIHIFSEFCNLGGFTVLSNSPKLCAKPNYLQYQL